MARESAERERRVFVFARFGTVPLKNIPQTFCTYTCNTLEEIRPKTQLVMLSRTVSLMARSDTAIRKKSSCQESHKRTRVCDSQTQTPLEDVVIFLACGFSLASRTARSMLRLGAKRDALMSLPQSGMSSSKFS